jgi:hypothetical protein
MSATTYTPLGYCNEEDIENFLLLNIDDSFSTQINTWIASAEKWVNTYLGYTSDNGVNEETLTNSIEDTATVDSEGNLVIFPRKVPVSSVSAITLVKGTDTLDLTLTSGGENKYQIPADSDTIVYPGFELAFSGSSVINNFLDLRYSKFFVKMTYVAGYSTLPPDIHLATVNVACDYIMRHTNKESLQSVSQGAISKTWFQRKGGESDFIKDAQFLLNPYRISSNWIRNN